MRVALLTYRFPWPTHTGDRVRAVRWLDAMRPLGEVTLIAPGGPGDATIEHVVVRPFSSALLRAAGRAALERLPLHTLAAARYDWHRDIDDAQRRQPFDAAVVLLSRLEPWVRNLRAGVRVVDAVDAASLSMKMRAQSSAVAARTFWQGEADRAARLERTFESTYDCVMVANERERRLFGERAIAIGSGVKILPPGATRRDFDFGFWGRLEYFVNRDAVRRLLEVIWPAIRRSRPDATLLVAGADVPPFAASHEGRNGVTIISPMLDRPSLLRRVRAAIFPLRNGTGISNKLLEAAEAGCAIVATPEALSGVERLQDRAVVASSDAGLAEAGVRLLDGGEIESRGAALRETVERHYSAAAAEEAFRRVLTGGALP